MDYIRPTPQQNPLLGLLAERLKQAQGFAAKPFGYSNPPAEMLMSLLGIPAVQQTMERMAYGEPLTTGRGMTTQVRPEVAEAALTVAPFAPLAGRSASGTARMVGQEMAERLATGKPMLPSLLAEPKSAMFIVPPSEARKINMPVSLPKSNEFTTAVKNEPSAQITDEGLLINLVRKQAPEQSMAESVRTGVFYLPEGQAANLKHYKGKSGYGGSEMIEGQTLYKNPIFVKGATGGKAPESAYDQIIGKGAYEEMRNDVLKSYGYNANQSQKIEAVQGLLQKYNGLDSDDAYNMAYNIVSNSKTGNTLPYAIQENIVGHAVRNAGHDAVIGYSKGRGDKGEFFSEVFDVREQLYPNAQGGYELMPKFDQMRKAVKEFEYPQQAALDAAQKNAALPISEGGLGLPPNNTPMDRAKAMGVDVETYHGSTSPNIQQFDVSLSGAKSGNPFDDYIFTTNNPESASGYALNWQSYKKNVEGSPEFQALEDKRKSLLKTLVKQADEGNIQNVGDIKQEISLINDQKIKLYNDFMEGKYVSEDATVYPLMTRSADFMPYEASGQNWMKVNRPAIEASQEAGYSGVNIQNVKDNAGKGYDLITDTYATNNPSLLRSRFAAFDPMRRNESDILAGLLPVSLLADPETRRKLDEELSLLYTK